MLFAPTANATMMPIVGEPGQVIYRYRTTQPAVLTPTAPQTKDITAFYIGVEQREFEEILPMKAEWQDDAWRIVNGTLPEGITFDPATKTFSGIPTTQQMGTVVELEGFDDNGISVATASASFDIYAVQGIPVEVDFYAHTGKYRYETLPIPVGLTIDKWEYIYGPPSGIEVNGPFYEGTPTTAGVTRLFIRGLNYDGQVVATFYGKYTVEDGPSFAHIPDNVKPLPQLEGGSWGLVYNFGAPNPHKVKRLIDPSRPASYFLEIAPGEDLPGSVKSNGLSKNLNLTGYVRVPYETAKIRFVAEDSDGTRGVSNWFTFGSSDPQPECNPYYTGLPLTVKTGISSRISVPRPWGKQGVVSYTLASGALPTGLTLNSTTGRIEGIPLISGEKTEIDVRVDVTNDANVVSTNCVYKMEVVPGNVRLTDVTPAQERHIRVGDVYTGTLNIVGGIPNYSTDVTNKADWPTLQITTPTQNTPSITVSGPINEAGNHIVGFTLANGDTSTKDGRLNISAHGDLDTGVVPTITVQRLALSQVWGSVPYDQTTVIPDVAFSTKFPAFTLDAHLSPLGSPAGINVISGDFFGTTAAKEGSYGPLTVTMSDYSGQTKTSNPFNIVVVPRQEIAVQSTRPANFIVEMGSTQTAKPVTYIQPPGADKFTVTWTLNDHAGQGLPSWLTFDRTTGEFRAAANVPFAAIRDYGPFSLTVTDQEGSTDTSDVFLVSATDWPMPQSVPAPFVRSNVTGNLAKGETQTRIDIPNLKNFIKADTVIGGLSAVTFVSADPASPAGLTFNPSDGSISGVPTEQFKGTVVVTFKDGKNRVGTIDIPLEVRPYPSIEMNGNSFDLPRLSAPKDATPALFGKTVSGFWNSTRFEWDPTSTPLPNGLTVMSDGSLSGKTDVPVGTVISGIRLVAFTTGFDNRTLATFTPDFDITVSAAKPFSLDYSKNTATFYSLFDASGLTLNNKVIPTASPSGSYVAPLVYSLDQAEAIADGMTGSVDINPVTGDIIGHPDKLGKWTVYVNLKDSKGTPVVAPYEMAIWSTLAGNVIPGDGKGGYAGGGTFTLRQDEPFETLPITLSQAVGTPIFSISPAAPIPSPDFDALTGAFTDNSAFTTNVLGYTITVDVKDSDGRKFNSSARPKYTFTVKKPLEVNIPATAQQIVSKQYSANPGDPIDAALTPDVQNKMGDIRYSLVGDMPGSLVHKLYDKTGNFVAFAYKDEAGVPQTETDETKLPLDALVFDTIAATIKGIPSKAGTFTGIHVVASDDHMDGYIKDVPNRARYNTATSPESLTITVAPADPLIATNSVGGVQADTDVAYQYTTVPSIKAVVANAAYGRPVSWTAVSGTLPPNVTASIGTSVTYTGYPEDLGTFGNIVWHARDAAGRTSNTDPATITVEPRKAFELVATNPVNLIVNTTDADVSVTPKFAAYGTPIGLNNWTVTGVTNLPPGVTHMIEADRVVFRGIATVIGTYNNVMVSAVDALGVSASISLTFEIALPTDAIILNVSDIKTKVGIPFEMQATSSNTYGRVRYYSHDITGSLGDQLNLNSGTGLASGAFNAVGNIDFDVYVTDDSNRVTTKPVLVEVMPDLRVTVPQEVQFEPGIAKTRATATDYALGTVAYEAGNPSNWPSGLTVNPATGAIESNGTTPLGTYGDLTVVATDTFTRVGQQFVDRTTSNVFAVKVDASGPYVGLTSATIEPWEKRKENYSFDLAAPSNGLLDYRAVGISEIAWNVPTQPAGRRFPPGLSLNAATGVISGKPTESGEFEFDIRARWKSNANVFSVGTYKMKIDLQKSKLVLAAGTLPDANAGKSYAFDFKTLLTHDFIPENLISWTRTNGDSSKPVPSGLSISNGVLSGTPSSGGDVYDIKIKATFDDNNPLAENFATERVYQFAIKKAAPVSTSIIQDRSFSTRQQITIVPTFANKHVADVYSIVNVNSYPKGLFYDGGPIAPGDTSYGFVLDTATGQLKGATRVSGTFPVQIKVTDNIKQEAVTNVFNLKITDNVPSVVGLFSDIGDVEPGVTVYSNPILISGNTAAATLTLEKTTPGITAYGRTCSTPASGAACSGGSFTTTTTATSGTYVVFQITAASTFDTPVTGTIDISGIKRPFTVTTRKSITTPTNLGDLGTVADAQPNGIYTSNVLSVTGITDPAPVTMEVVSGSGSATGYICTAEIGAAGTCYGAAGTGGRYLSSFSSNSANVRIENDQTLQVRVTMGPNWDQTTVVKVAVGGETRLFTVTTKPIDITPDNLGQFVTVNDAERNTTVPSNTILVDGLTTSTDARIELISGPGPATVYKCAATAINSGNCYSSGRSAGNITTTTTNGKVTSGDYLQVLLGSPTTYGAASVARVTIGDTTRDFTVTTPASGVVSAATSFTDHTDVAPSATVYSNVIQVQGIPAGSKASLEIISGTSAVAPNAYICSSASMASSGNCFGTSRFKSRFATNLTQNVADGDFVQIAATAPAGFGDAITLRVNAGGLTKDWTVLTRTPDSTPDDLGEYQEMVNVEPGIVVISNGLLVRGVSDPTTVMIERLEGTATVYGRTCAALYTGTNSCATISSQFVRTIPMGATNGLINDGESLVLISTAPTDFGAKQRFRITIGTVVREFTYTTRGSVTTPIDLGEPGTIVDAEPGETVLSSILKVSGTTEKTTWSAEVSEGTFTLADVRLIACAAGYQTVGDCSSVTAAWRYKSIGSAIPTVLPDDYLQVSLTAGPYGETRKVRITVGGVQRVFSVTTRAANSTPVDLDVFDDIKDATAGTNYSTRPLQVNGNLDNVTVTSTAQGNVAGDGTYFFVCSTAQVSANTCGSSFVSRNNPGVSFTVKHGEFIMLRTKAPAAAGGNVKLTVNVGGEVREWNVTTAAAPAP
jgi:hypothetical protein